MTNETVMFEFEGNKIPFNTRPFHAEGCYIFFDDEETKIPYESLEDFYAAKLKAQGWLSPDEQRPFCMKSARELGVKFKQNQLFIFTRKTRSLPEFGKTRLIGEKRVMTFMVEHSFIDYVDLENIESFYPYNNPHETRRLEALGVKRYEKGGE